MLCKFTNKPSKITCPHPTIQQIVLRAIIFKKQNPKGQSTPKTKVDVQNHMSCQYNIWVWSTADQESQ